MQENYDDLFTQEPEASEEPQQGGPLSKEEYAAKMKAQRDGLSELANQTEMEIAGDGGTFQQYLDTLARFDRYSPQNTLLIFAQRPDAVKLGDYEHWKRAGTPVSRGASGISIFEPGKEYRKEDGAIGTSMNIKRVFDISQTAARNKLQPDPSRDIRALLKALMSRPPAPIQLVDALSEGSGAHYNEQRGVIEVTRGLDGESLFRCLSQEIAYAGLDRQPPDTLTCADKGFSAYAASYALCQKYGIDAKGYDFSEAPEVFAHRDGKEMRGEIKAIRDTVNEIAGRMAKALEPPQKSDRNQEERAS